MARFIAGSVLFLAAKICFRSGGNSFQALKYISVVIANLFIAVIIIGMQKIRWG